MENILHTIDKETALPSVTVPRPPCFDLDQIFDCGQSFRFTKVPDGAYEGIAYGRAVRFYQTATALSIVNCTEDEYNTVWRAYFALDTDYPAIRAELLRRSGDDAVLRQAMACGEGIRILRQEPWETLCTFILSQNNNIPRIRGLIAALSARWGTPVKLGEKILYTFPPPDAFLSAGVDELFALKTGFRAKYLYDAAENVSAGAIDFDRIRRADFDDAMEQLCTIRGVGPKVAACVLLFAFGKTEAFPIDVWIKKALSAYYPEGLDIAMLGKYAGIAQQYLFYYTRNLQKEHQ